MTGMEGLNVDQLSGLMVGGILGVLAGGVVIGGIIRFILSVLNIIGCWKMYRKFGEPGWKCLIPFYGTWVEYKYTWKPMMAIPVWVLGFGCEIVRELVNKDSVLGNVLGIVTVIGWIITIIGFYKLSKAFGHGVGFTIGLVLIPSIFITILGLGKSQYLGNTTTGEMAEAASLHNPAQQ